MAPFFSISQFSTAHNQSGKIMIYSLYVNRYARTQSRLAIIIKEKNYI
uniref:Uncharacterized protein n=1 Tax=Arundo donax TaxID=35708 RepID=A0A0A9GUP9_ARUDO